MKHTHICPKCHSDYVVKISGDISEIGNYMVLGMTKLSAVCVDRYVCCDCGYSEEWIEENGLKSIQKKFPKQEKKTRKLK